MSIGLLLGVTVRPRTFWLRGLVVGGLVMLPLGFVSLAVPTCGPVCMGANILTGAVEGCADRRRGLVDHGAGAYRGLMRR